MANVMEGLETGPSGGEDPNTEAGFAARFARKAGEVDGPQAEELSPSTAISEGLTFGTEDEPAAAPATPAAPADTPTGTTTEEGDQPPVEDPALAALLEQHGGDPIAALAAVNERFTHAQSLIGRQGNDLGQLREQVAELRGMVQAQQAAAVAPAQAVSGEQVSEWVSEQGGASVALWAAQQGDDSLVEAVIREWARQAELEGESTFDALAFRQDYLEFRRRQEAEAAAARQPAPTEPDMTQAWVQRQVQQERFEDVLTTLQNESTDWDSFSPHILKALEVVPKSVLAMVTSDDDNTALDGARIVADKARVLAGTTDAASGASAAAAAALGEQRARAAQVATGSLRPVTERQPVAEMSSEDRIALFRKQFRETDTTSVSDGLTFGK